MLGRTLRHSPRVHAFIMVLGSSNPNAGIERAKNALHAVRENLPDIGAELEVTVQTLQNQRVVLGLLGPRVDYSPPLLSLHTSADRTTFCFGKLDRAGTPAAIVDEVFSNHGLEAARKLSGCFAATVFDATRDELTAFTDLIGMRGFRYSERDGLVTLASHDLVLAAAGMLTGALDLDSIAATVACDWSLSGKSFLKGVECFGAHGLGRWHASQFQVRHTAPETQGRLEPGDRHGIRQQLEKIVFSMEQGATQLAKTQTTITCSLTGGKDSRLVLGLLSGAGARIEAQTNGTSTSPDVITARRLASALGVPHTTVAISEPTSDTFEAMTELLSFSMNGMTNAKRALSHLPRYDPERRILAGGVGGGIFAGAFYHYLHLGKELPRDVHGMARVLETRRFRRMRELPFSDPQCSSRLGTRLRQALEFLATYHTNAWDMIDAFYLFERYARWAAFGERNGWARRWTPFENSDAIRYAQALPPPIGSYCTLQPIIVRRHLPLAAYLMPVNNETFLFLQGGGKNADRLRRLLRRSLQRIASRFRARGTASGEEGSEQVRARIFQNSLLPYLRETLGTTTSVALDLFGKEGTLKLFAPGQDEAHQLQTLGFLITAELFRRQVERVTPRQPLA